MSNLDVSLRLRLINMLGAPSQQARRDLDQLAASARKLQGTKADRLGGDLARMKTEAAGAGKEVSKLAISARRLDAAKADRLGRDLARLRGDASGAQQFVERLASSVARLDGRGADRLAAGLRRAASAAASASQATEKLQRATGNGRGVGASGKGGGKGSGAVLLPPGVIAPVIAVEGARRVVGAGLNTSIEQEKAWAEVQKKVDGSPEQMAGLQQTLRKQARSYGMTIPEAFHQAAEAGAANIPINEIPAFIEQTMKASIGWDMDARRTAEVLSKTKVGNQLSLAELGELANKINMVGDKSGSKERDIAEMFGRAAQSGATAGMSHDDSLAVLAAANSAGVDPEVSARWFGAFGSKLAGAHAGSKKQKEGFKMLGLNPDKVAEGMEKDAFATMQKVFEAIEKAPQKKKIAATTSIFGEGWWDETARVGKALPEILRLRKLLNDPKNYQGSLDNNLAIQMATTQAHLDRMKTTVTEIGDQMFKWSLKHINREIDDFIGKFEKGETLKSAGRKIAAGEPLTEEEQKAYAEAKTSRGPLSLARMGHPVIAARIMQERELEDIERRLEAARKAKSDAEAGRASAKGHFQSGRMDREVERATQALEALDAKRTEIMQKLSSADPGAAASASMQRFTAAIESEGAKAVEASRGIAAQITDIFRMHLQPTISPRFGTPSGGEGSKWGPGPTTAPAPGKGSYTKVGAINVYGAGDPQGTAAAIRKELARLGDSSNALFDTV